MKKGFFVISALIIGIALSSSLSYAEISIGTDEEKILTETEITEGLSHEEFAKLLVEEVETEGLLPTAATTNDIFKFWEDLGVVPPGGWDAESIITREDLIAILGISEEEANDLLFEDLLKRLKKKILDILAVKKGTGAPVISPIAPVYQR